MTFKRLTDLDVAGKRVFIRADLNVPQDDNLAITDDTRIRAALPGIQYALSKGAAVMVTSHLGRPTAVSYTHLSLETVSKTVVCWSCAAFRGNNEPSDYCFAEM